MKDELLASPEMMIFFERLLSLKDYVKEESEKSDNIALKNTYTELESLIKQKQ